VNQKELISFYNEITPTGEQKRNMYAKIRALQAGEAQMKKTTKKASVLVAAMAACFLFATAVFASTWNWNELLIQYFKPSEKQMKVMTGTVNTPEATVTNNGITVTIKQTIVDSLNVYVLYELTVPESIELNDDIGWEKENFKLQPHTAGFGSGGSTILKQDKHTRTLLFHRGGIPVRNGNSTAILIFENLALYQKIYDKKGEYLDLKRIPLIEGEWQVTWDIKIDDSQSIKLEPNKPVSLNGSKNNITKVEVSPLSVYIIVEGSAILTRVEPIIKFKDGSQISFNYTSPGKSFSYANTMDHNGTPQGNHLYYAFDHMISPDDVESISIENVTIPVSR